MEIRLSGHSAYRTEYQMVWIPKYRHRTLNPGVRGYLRKLFPKILRSMPGGEVVEYNIQVDHVHMVMAIPPKYAVSEIVGKMKGTNASLLRKKVFLAGQGVLERECCLVTRIFCFNSGNR